ncbi:MAG TPA: hypothetical protein VF062_23440 [Candidatus Limnocylindrales bacterium]
MAWQITPADDGTYDWSAFQSAFGSASGNAPTLAAAKVELAIAEAAITEAPYPPAAEDAMRADPERFAAGFRDPTSHNERTNMPRTRSLRIAWLIPLTLIAAGAAGTVWQLATTGVDLGSAIIGAFLGILLALAATVAGVEVSRRRTTRRLRAQFAEAARTGQPVILSPGVTLQQWDDARSAGERPRKRGRRPAPPAPASVPVDPPKPRSMRWRSDNFRSRRPDWSVAPDPRPARLDPPRSVKEEMPGTTVPTIADFEAEQAWRDARHPAPTCQVSDEHGQPVCIRTFDQPPCNTCPREIP